MRSSETTPPPEEVASPRRRLLSALFGWSIGALAIAGVVAWAILGGGPTAPVAAGRRSNAAGGRPTAVATVVAARGAVPVYLDGLGSATPLATVAVKSRVDGQLMRLHFVEGQDVAAGALLAEIDPRPFQVQLAQAEGQRARDEALLQNAIVDLERYQALFAQDSIAKQQLDSQQSLVRQYQAALKSDEGQVANAQLQLEYAQIKAPIGGKVGLRQVDAGNMVHAGDSAGLVVITQMRPIMVVFTIAEDDLPAVIARTKRSEPIPVEVWDRAVKTKLADGELESIDNQIDPTTGMIRLKAKFANGDGMLFPNQFVNVRMLVDTRTDVVVVPPSALQIGAQGTYVWVVGQQSMVAPRVVKVGPSEAERVVIESGLEAGEVVVVEGVDRLREGATVQAAGPADGARPAQPATGPTRSSGEPRADGGRRHGGG